MKKKKTKIWVVGAICSLALAGVAPVAGAQTAAQQGYDESGLLGFGDDSRHYRREGLVLGVKVKATTRKHFILCLHHFLRHGTV